MTITIEFLAQKHDELGALINSFKAKRGHQQTRCINLLGLNGSK